MQEMQKQNKKRKRTKELVVLSHFFCRSINVDIFTEIMAFGEELDKVAQVMDEAVAHMLLPPPITFCHNRALPKTPYHTLFITQKVSWTVMVNWTLVSPGEKSRTSPLSSSGK